MPNATCVWRCLAFASFDAYCTVRTVVAFTPFKLAWIVVVPDEALLARPLDLMVATVASEVLHAACKVTGRTEPSLKVPWAENCSEVPSVIVGFAGLTVIESRFAFVTVSVAVALWPAKTAVIVALPGATPVATPMVSVALLTVVTEGADEVHLTAEVMSKLWPSLNSPVALSCVSMVFGTLEFCGVIFMDCNVEPSTSRFAVLLNPPDVAVIATVPAD